MEGKWKSIPMSHNFFSGGGMDQAVCGGIEELTDYTLLLKGNKSGKVRTKNLSAPAMKTDLEIGERKRKIATGDEMSAAKKVKVSHGNVIDRHKKQKKKNTFKVVDLEDESDFIQLSRSKVVEEATTKKKKKNKKSGKNKPAINLEAFGGLVAKVKEAEPVVEQVKNAKETEDILDKDNCPKKKK